MNKLQFSKVVNIEEDLKREGNLLSYIASCGSGKSFAITDSKEGLAAKGTILFLTSRIAKVDEEVGKEDSLFENDFKSDYCTVTNIKLLYKIKSLMEYRNDTTKLDEFLDKFDYIVVDEVHALACDSLFQDNIVTIISFLKYAGLVKNKNIITMSATLEPVKKLLLKEFKTEDKEMKLLDVSNKCIAKMPSLVVNITKEKVLKSIENLAKNKKKFVYFANTYESIEKIYNSIIKNGVDKKEIAVLMSKSNQSKFDNEYATKKQNIAVRESLAEDSILPENTKVLIATSALKEGISINNEDIDYVFCEAHYKSDVVQYMGRVRKPAKLLTIVSDAVPVLNAVDEVDYKFCCCKEFLNSCKTHLSSLKYEKGIIDEKHEFIKFLNKKFEYLSYDFIKNEFVVDTVRYNMQRELELHLNTWERDLEEYLKEFNLTKFLNVSGEAKYQLIKSAERQIRSILGVFQWGDDAKKVYSLFALVYGTKSKQYKSFKKEVEPLFYSVEYKDTTINNKHVRGIKVDLIRDDNYWADLMKFFDDVQKKQGE